MQQELHITLTPRASFNRILADASFSSQTKSLKVYVTAVPEQGKANEAMINLLAKHYRLPKTAFTLVRGHKGRNKVVIVNLKSARLSLNLLKIVSHY